MRLSAFEIQLFLDRAPVPYPDDLRIAFELNHTENCHLDHEADQIRYRVNFHPALLHNVDIFRIEQLLSCGIDFACKPVLGTLPTSSLG